MKTNPLRLGWIYKLMLLGETGSFFKRNEIPFHFKDRHDLYEYIQKEYIGDQPIDFLEFGVYKGDSLNIWIELNNNPKSQFYGFDSFCGLPENWTKVWRSLPEGYFNVDGKTPNIEDIRVNLIKGWFQDTLGNFLKDYETNGNLKVLHMDADLYSSTLFVLTKLDSYLNIGDIMIFDEFSDGDECKAFLDYSMSYMKKFKILAVSGASYQQVAFIRIL